MHPHKRVNCQTLKVTPNQVQPSRPKPAVAQSSQTKLNTAMLNPVKPRLVSSVPDIPSQFYTTQANSSQANLRPGESKPRQQSQFHTNHTNQSHRSWDEISLPQQSQRDYTQTLLSPTELSSGDPKHLQWSPVLCRLARTNRAQHVRAKPSRI